MPSPNFLALIVSEISAFIRTEGLTDRRTDMARSTRLVILIKNIYTLCYVLSDEHSIPFYSASYGYKKTKINK